MACRIEYLDLAKGLGIFCIVIGHSAVLQWMHDWVYSFHVPMFFIISGYFYRKRTLSETSIKVWRQLVFPMLITILIAQLGLSFLYLRHGEWQGPPFGEWISEVLLMRGKGYVCGMWFLAALAWGKILFCLYHKMGDYALLFAVIVSFIVGALFSNVVNIVPWSFVRGLYVPMFLYIGMQLNKYAIIDKLSTAFYQIVALSVVCVAWLSPVDVSGFIYPYGLVSILTIIVVSMSVLIVIKKLSELSTLTKKVFLFAGQNSLLILCVHSLIHTWQLPGIFWQSLPPIGNLHFVLHLGVVAFAECAILVMVAYFLNKSLFVARLFHAK